MILNTSITGVPAFTGIVHKYNVKNATGRTTLKFTAGSGDAPVINGASVPLTTVLNAGEEGVIYSPVGKFELNTPLQNGELVAVYNSNSNLRGDSSLQIKSRYPEQPKVICWSSEALYLKINNTPPQAGEALAGPRLFPTN